MPRICWKLTTLSRRAVHLPADTISLIRGLPEKPLKGACETDEAYVKAGSKRVALDTNGEDRTVPSRRGLPHGPGRSTFEKNMPMVTIYFQRATEDEPDITIMDVPRDGPWPTWCRR